MGLRVVNIYVYVILKERSELFFKLDIVFMINRYVIVGGDFNFLSEGSKIVISF